VGCDFGEGFVWSIVVVVVLPLFKAVLEEVHIVDDPSLEEAVRRSRISI
jgi:hypothetical protein